MRFQLTFLLLFLFVGVARSQDSTGTNKNYQLPRRVMVLEKALIKLRDQGAQLSYRPDLLPQITVKVSGGKRSLGGWLGFLLRNTEITYERTSAGYLLYPDQTLPSQLLNLYGVVKDAESGERLLGAAVQLPDEARGVVANEYGFYSLPINGGRRTVRVSYIGYEALEIEVVFRSDTLIDFPLRPSRELPAVIVRAKPAGGAKLHLTDTKSSIGREEVDRIGGPGGESDPLRLARLLPGVESGADGLGGIFIRGSESGHNLVLLDGVPVYNLSHAAGLFSIFSNEAIRRVDLYKDGIPARFGGRVGGVLDVHTRDGNLYEAETSVGTSMLAAHVTSEGPIAEGRSSYLVTGRYFWAGGLLGAASERYKNTLGRTGRIDYQVYDVNFKLNQELGQKGRLHLSLFRGSDRYNNSAFESDTLTVLNPAGAVFNYAAPRRRYEDVAWTNTVAALRYNYVFNRRFFGNFRLSLSDLNVDASYERSDSLNEISTNINTGDVFSGRYGSDITQLGLAFDGQYTLLDESEIRFGVEANRHEFTPQLNSGPVPLTFHPEIRDFDDANTLRPEEISTYASLTGRLGELNYRIGLRGQWWRNDRSYFNISPRLLLSGRISPSASWRLSFDRTVQSVHLVSSTVIGLPSDIWVPSTRAIRPSSAAQVSATYLQRIGKDWNLETAVYYRDLKNLVDFSESVGQTSWVDNLSQGDGFARGAEFTLSRSTTKFRGWLSYVLAQSKRQFDANINLGRPFNFRYGRTHGVKFLALYMPSPSISLSATWRYGSGANYSLGEETFLLVNPATLAPGDEVETVNLIKDKNGVRLPANHRLDLNAQFELGAGKADRRVFHTLDVGIYNVYSRHNPIYYDIQTDYFSRDEQLIANRDFIQVYLAPITPTFSYRLKFGHAGN